MKKGRLHFLLYSLLTFIVVVFAVKTMIPADGLMPQQEESDILSAQARVHAQGGSIILPIPDLSAEELLSAKVLLGKKLFNDPKLSGDGTVSCASCHDLEHGGGDGRKLPVGVGNAVGDYNTPTVFNSVFNFRQFWDGRAATLHEQIPGPLMNIAEMASNWAIAIRRVSENPEYVNAFKQEYGGEISDRTIVDAIARYESTLITPNAPFDRYLKGDTGAISDSAKEGYRRFIDYGCISCHQGVNVGGNFFQRFGVIGNYFADRGSSPSKPDLGRYNVTGRKEDRYVFKVPSLRNVAVTAPYFHDGSADTLDEAIKIMGRYQLGRELPEEDRRYIAEFLESLTGEFQGKPLLP